MPICSRCSTKGLSCVYTPSRRGFRQERSADCGPFPHPAQLRRSASTNAPSTPSLEFPSAQDPETTSSENSSTVNYAFPDHRELGSLPQLVNGNCFQRSSALHEKAASPTGQDEEYLTQLFYSHFYPTHPFIVPHARYRSQANPRYLALTVQFVGSHYASPTSTISLVAAVDAALQAESLPSTHLVQSLLLFAIVLHARAELRQAGAILARACNVAIELGLHRQALSSTQYMQDELEQESQRRTWWELYLVDCYFAALQRQKSFACNEVDITTPLPCEESAYAVDMLRPTTTSVYGFDRRLFSSEDTHFSSASYRIAAIRILARCMALVANDTKGEDDVRAVDNAIAAWKFHLPPDKADFFNHHGEVDQLILQAHYFVNYATILLHYTRSELLLRLPSMNEIQCVRHMKRASPTSAQHTLKATSASLHLSDLATLPVNRHSPLFTCCLVFACIVQISACSLYSHDCRIQDQEAVALLTGALKQQGRIWPLALDVLRHLNRIATLVFDGRATADLDTSATTLDSMVDMSGMSDTFSWLDQIFGGEDFRDAFTNMDWVAQLQQER